MRHIIAGFLFALSLAFAAPANAQIVCNSASGFVKLKGPFLAGDVPVLDSDCLGLSDGGSGAGGLPSPANLYVATAANGGSDSNTCLFGNPCLTIQHVLNLALSTYNFLGANLNIIVGPGSFAGFGVQGKNIGDNGFAPTIVVLGSGRTQTFITSTISVNYSKLQIGSFYVSSVTGSDILVENYSNVTLYDGGMEFGPAPTSIIDCVGNSSFNGQSTYGFIISGSSSYGFLISTNSNVTLSVGATYTISGVLSFPNGFVDAIDGSGFNPGITSVFNVTGSVTGPTYNMAVNSWIDMEQNPNPLPGSLPGIVGYGAVYYGAPQQNTLAAGVNTITVNGGNVIVSPQSGGFAGWSSGTLAGIGSQLLSPVNGGTGVNNATNTISVTGGNIAFVPGTSGSWPIWVSGTFSGGVGFGTYANAAVPSSPASGSENIWTDSTDLRLHDVNSAGVVGTTAVAKTSTTHQWLNAMSAAGVFSASQPACSDLSSVGPGCAAAAGQLPGTATNDNAASGNLGEYISSAVASGSAVGLTNGTPANLTSISLTAGDWDVDAVCNFTGAATTLVTALACGVSATTATFDNSNGRDALTYVSGGTAALYNAIVGGFPPPTVSVFHRRFSLASTTTIFGVAGSQFSTSTSSVYGVLNARRAR